MFRVYIYHDWYVPWTCRKAHYIWKTTFWASVCPHSTSRKRASTTISTQYHSSSTQILIFPVTPGSNSSTPKNAAQPITSQVAGIGGVGACASAHHQLPLLWLAPLSHFREWWCAIKLLLVLNTWYVAIPSSSILCGRLASHSTFCEYE